MTTEALLEKKLYIPRLAQVSRVQGLTERESLFEFRFIDGSDLGHRPGQFVEVSILGVGEAPISITSSPTHQGSFELAVRKLGSVTSALHSLKMGSVVGIRGPFGNGFPLERLAGRDVLLVAGGIGLFPLRSLVRYVLDKRHDYDKVTFLFGVRCPEEQLFLDELELYRNRDDIEYHETVDACTVGGKEWTGNVGVITTLFPKMRKIDPLNTMAVIVGPPVMYRFVIAECKKLGIPDDHIIMSLERKMKCGVGKCGHCQINGLYVCQEGPVFTYAELKRLKEAVS